MKPKPRQTPCQHTRRTPLLGSMKTVSILVAAAAACGVTFLVAEDASADLEKRAATPELVRIEVGHGNSITSEPAAALRAAAAGL
jgi:hypothetical protein